MPCHYYFIFGGAMALGGVVLARILAPFCFTGFWAWLFYLAGVFLATGGLLCIALGFRQRILRREENR